MRSFDPATAAAIAAPSIVARALIWIRARDRVSGAEQALGLWTGDDSAQFTINGQSRSYAGAGALLSIDPIISQSGLLVRMSRITLSPLAPEVAQAIRGYDPRLAPVEIHRALFSPDTFNLVAEPHRVFSGWIDELVINTPEVGGEATVEVTLASSARALTRGLPIKKSDETQKRRSGDRFRRWADISAAVDVYWGELRAAAPAAPATPKPASGQLPSGRR